MQVDADDPMCPNCGAAALEFFSVLHHMPCAYVGPQYDFAQIAAGYNCPKCVRAIAGSTSDCEIVGTSARCRRCRTEIVVFPAPTVP